MNAQLAKYESQINEIALFAKEINFDIVNGDIEELVRKWLKRDVPFYDDDNREAVKRMVKNYL